MNLEEFKKKTAAEEKQHAKIRTALRKILKDVPYLNKRHISAIWVMDRHIKERNHNDSVAKNFDKHYKDLD